MKAAEADWPDRHLFTQVCRWPTGLNPEERKYEGFAVRSHRYRMVGTKALYDMVNDPGQKNNVIDRHPEIVQQMLKAYDGFWEETRPLLVNEKAPMSQTWPFHELYNEQNAAGGIPAWIEPDLD